MAIEQQIFDSMDMLTSFFLGSAFITLLFSTVLLTVLFIAAVYIYFAFAYKSIAEKLKYKKSWLAWIPVAQWAMLLQLGGFHWAWIFLLLVPILGWLAFIILLIIAHWKIFEKLKYPGWFSLSMIIPRIGFILYGIAVGIVAWQKKSAAQSKKSH